MQVDEEGDDDHDGFAEPVENAARGFEVEVGLDAHEDDEERKERNLIHA